MEVGYRVPEHTFSTNHFEITFIYLGIVPLLYRVGRRNTAKKLKRNEER